MTQHELDRAYALIDKAREYVREMAKTHGTAKIAKITGASTAGIRNLAAGRAPLRGDLVLAYARSILEASERM